MSWAEAKMINGSIGTSDFITIDELIRGARTFVTSSNVLSSIPVGVTLEKRYTGDTTYRTEVTTTFKPLLSGNIQLKISYSNALVADATDTTHPRSDLQVTMQSTEGETIKTVKLDYEAGSGDISTVLQVDSAKSYILTCTLTNDVPSQYVSTGAKMTIDTIKFCGDVVESYITTGEIE